MAAVTFVRARGKHGCGKTRNLVSESRKHLCLQREWQQRILGDVESMQCIYTQESGGGNYIALRRARGKGGRVAHRCCVHTERALM
jgi:hypothetical protein